jgi:hypothetical protein
VLRSEFRMFALSWASVATMHPPVGGREKVPEGTIVNPSSGVLGFRGAIRSVSRKCLQAMGLRFFQGAKVLSRPPGSDHPEAGVSDLFR